jgi:hypothetical protein
VPQPGVGHSRSTRLELSALLGSSTAATSPEAAAIPGGWCETGEQLLDGPRKRLSLCRGGEDGPAQTRRCAKESPRITSCAAGGSGRSPTNNTTSRLQSRTWLKQEQNPTDSNLPFRLFGVDGHTNARSIRTGRFQAEAWLAADDRSAPSAQRSTRSARRVIHRLGRPSASSRSTSSSS